MSEIKTYTVSAPGAIVTVERKGSESTISEYITTPGGVTLKSRETRGDMTLIESLELAAWLIAAQEAE